MGDAVEGVTETEADVEVRADGHGMLRLSLACAIGTTLVGLTVMTGWVSGNDLMKRALPNQIIMLPWTALGLAIGGACLCIESHDPVSRQAKSGWCCHDRYRSPRLRPWDSAGQAR